MQTDISIFRWVVGALALMLAFSPLIGFAKENENKGKKDDTIRVMAQIKSDKKEVRFDDDRKNGDSKNRSALCIRAFGHLIAPGLIKKNATSTTDINCYLPFGIGKKFHGTTTNSTSTSDTLAPVIRSVIASPNQTSAGIKWMTDERSTSVVFYATTSSAIDVNSTRTPRAMDRGLEKEHALRIGKLLPSTTYYFKVGSRDKAGNISYSETMSFTTKAKDVTVTYPVISNITTLVGSTTVGIAWKTNEPATTKVYYGTISPDVNSVSTLYVVDSSLVTNHAIRVTGLSTSTPYMFIVESRNAVGNATYSTSFTATTNSGL